MSSRPDESGYTMVEAAVALALLSLLAGAIAAFSFGGFRALEGARAAYASARTLGRMEEAMRREAGKIRIPFWDRGARLEESSGDRAEARFLPEAGASAAGRASIAYYEGEREKLLSFGWELGRLVLAAPEAEEDFAPIEELRVFPMPASGACPRGLRIEFTMRGKRYAIAAHFGGAALGEGRD